jgi:hypothetical protein
MKMSPRNCSVKVSPLPLSQMTESDIPADFIFADPKRLKVFGLQFKALYRNGGDHWPLDRTQHRKLTRYPWIYYCFSELTTVADHRLGLDFARIVRPTAVQPPQVSPSLSLVAKAADLVGIGDGVRSSRRSGNAVWGYGPPQSSGDLWGRATENNSASYWRQWSTSSCWTSTVNAPYVSPRRCQASLDHGRPTLGTFSNE